MEPTAHSAGTGDMRDAGSAAHSAASLDDAHAALQADALRRVGGPDASAGRAALLYEIYRDSRGNHVAPLIALHMMLWRQSFFAVDGHLGTVLQYRYCYDERERARRLTMLQEFAGALREIDGHICARIYADYHATKRHGADLTAHTAVPDDLCQALNAVHGRTRVGDRLAPYATKEVFMQSWRHEQEAVMAAPLHAAVEKLDCPILRALIVQPAVHLAYFPAHTRIVYRDFAQTAERTARAAQAYDLAAARGWAGVTATLHAYGVLPPSFFRTLDAPTNDCQAPQQDPTEPVQITIG